ncbi:acetyl-CoA C-acetyltransferase [Pseudobdellovibrio exovorus]|uniref:Acetyl-CoA acetyltransferase n=1 Tax=Pseudobdellovibrio exovorus JSS TaxID=1184267 RepID=M4VAL5_9BACT|nr:acetyl-CoA C-acetyltransferase [Pseudobdellovibrio exovorus]AGH95490.1 acetyl-CoA acetyltransferase [Pseudobdellovibrio exovorus JSS]
MEKVVIVSAVRTPVASFQGAFAGLAAPRLGAIAIKAALEKVNVATTDVSEVIMGEVLTAGVGQAPARQAAIYAGVSNSTPCLTINKVCGSGLKAVMLGADSIRLGTSKVVVAGGQENMTLSPHLLENSRTGYRMGSQSIVDSMIKDGLWDPYNNFHMGNAAEVCSRDFEFTREAQDAFAIDSYKKAQKAIAEGRFKNEICPVNIETKKGTVTVDTDEEPGKAMFDKMPQLRPAFEKEGTITAANASKLNDGAAALVLMSETEAKKRGLKPLATIVSYATFAQEPQYFTTAPVGAIKKSLELANLSVGDIDHFEINEAFANVTMAAQKSLEIPAEKTNIHGGAIAIGHPIGASGARILTTLVHSLHTNNLKRGLATLCIGGGEAVSLIVERN